MADTMSWENRMLPTVHHSLLAGLQRAPVNYPAMCIISASFSHGPELGLLPTLLQQKLLSSFPHYYMRFIITLKFLF